jgi:hypothetical protein
MKKILFLTPFEPSQNTGGQNFTRMLLNDLSRFNQIDIVMFLNCKVDFELPRNNVRILKTFYVNQTTKLLNALMLPFFFPFFSVRFNLFYLYTILNLNRKKKYDYIYLDYSQLFIYGLFLKSRKILMSHDVIEQRYSRNSNKLIARFCFLTESFILKRQYNSKIFTFSDKDSNLLLNNYNVKSFVTNFYIDRLNTCEIEQVHNRIVLFGSWKRAENYEGLLWFVDNIQPYLDLDIDVLIIGGGLDNDMIERLSKIKAIKYLGFVKNPEQLISESKFLIAPVFHGAGVKVKVIDALSLGTAVLGTDLAFEGVSSIYSNFMIVANDAGSFIHHINNKTFSKVEKNEFKLFFHTSYSDHAISEYITFNS